jgi:HEAT repeat protein
MDKNVTFKGSGADSAIATARSPAGTTDVEALIHTIRNSQDSAVLKSATIRIVELRDPRFIEPLIGTLKSNNNNARRLATWALGAREEHGQGCAQ